MTLPDQRPPKLMVAPFECPNCKHTLLVNSATAEDFRDNSWNLRTINVIDITDKNTTPTWTPVDPYKTAFEYLLDTQEAIEAEAVIAERLDELREQLS